LPKKSIAAANRQKKSRLSKASAAQGKRASRWTGTPYAQGFIY